MKLLTLARDLQRRRARERLGLFVAEGVRAVEELLRAPIRLRGALVTRELAMTPRGAALWTSLDARQVTMQEVEEREFRAAADTDTPQGVLAIGEIPHHALDAIELPASARLLVLDAIQDPGNVGTLIRTAAALGVSATLALPGTVDLWNAKVVRSAMGSLFHHPAFHTTWEALDAFLGAHALELWGADAAGEPVLSVSAPARLAIAVGNEGGGLSDAARARATRRVAIPLASGTESLNVAVAAGILLHQLRP